MQSNQSPTCPNTFADTSLSATLMTKPIGFARILPGTEHGDSGPIYRSIITPTRPTPVPPADAVVDAESSKQLEGLTLPFAESVFHVFTESAAKFADLPCLGKRQTTPAANGEPEKVGDYEWTSYREVGARVARTARGLMRLGLLPRVIDSGGAGERMVAIYMKNSPDWVVCEQAAYACSAVVVALYDSLGPDSTRFIVNQTQLGTVVCSKLELRKIAAVARGSEAGSSDAVDNISTGVPSLKNIVLTGERDPDAEADAIAAGLKVVHLVDDIEKAGLDGEQLLSLADPELTPPSRSSIATIMYTSGTTGDPKGVVLSHLTLTSSCAATLDFMATSGRPFSPDTVYLSFLPLAHIYERSAQIALFASGSCVGFSRGNPVVLMQDVAALRPTVFCAVPRVLNRLYDGIMAKMLAPAPDGGQSMRARIFSMALASKQRRLSRRGQHEHAFWDRIVFKRIKASLGLDRCWSIMSGSAPLSRDVFNFCRIVFVCNVIEGYGQTETCGGVTTTSFSDPAPAGFVGSPNVGSEIKLVSVPDMNYLVTDREHDEGDGVKTPCMGRGEICVRGPLLFSGYYKNPEKTKEVMGDDGWLRTGDIGLWSSLGQLRIIDRKKNLFKLSQGEYVAPEKIENVLATCPTVAQAFVTGDSLHSHLVAVIVPDEVALRSMAKLMGYSHLVADSSLPSTEVLRVLCDQKLLREAVLKEMDVASKKAKLAGFEHVRAVYLHHELFTVENELLTPTFKLRRADAQRVFRAQIESMYRESGDRVGGR